MQKYLDSLYEALKSFQDELKSRLCNLLLRIDLIISNLSENEKLKYPFTPLIVVIFISLLAGSAYLFYRHINPVSSSDAVVLLRTAKYIYLDQTYRGEGALPYFLDPNYYENNPFMPMPMYPFILAIFFYLFGYTLESATLVSPFFGTLTIIMVYFVGYKLFNKQVGLLSALLLVFIPYFWLFTTRIVSEIGQAFFFLTALYFLYSSPKTNRSLVALGIFSTAFFLTKINGILIYPIIFLTLVIRKELKIKYIMIIVAASFLPLLPWLIIILINQYSIFAGYGWMGDYYVSRIMSGQIGQVLFTKYTDRVPKTLMSIPAIISWQVLVFSAVGIIIAIGKKFDASLQLSIAMGVIILSAVRYPFIRYLFVTIPLFVIFAAYGIIKIYEYIYQDTLRLSNLLSFSYLLVILLGLSLSLYVMGDYFVRTFTWLSLNLAEESLIAPISFSPIFVIPTVILSFITALLITVQSQENLKKRFISSNNLYEDETHAS